MVGCALGNAEWRRQANTWEPIIPYTAGDARCSPPAPYTGVRACLAHDGAYELAREYRSGCREVPVGDSADQYTSEQIRAVRDFELAADMLRDGEPEFWAWVYLIGVRWGGWYSWYLKEETCAEPEA